MAPTVVIPKDINLKPYYEENGIQIFHGDCREVLPSLPKVDLVLTDPPYGIALNTHYSQRKSNDIQGRDYDPIVGDGATMDFTFLFDLAPRSVVWGANNWPQQIPFQSLSDGWLCWDKRTNERADQILGSPFELAVVLGQRTYKFIRLQHCGVKNGDGDSAGRFHPTQKPVELMRRTMKLFSGDSVLDPFMGSGTTLRAAKDLGRKAIGIEIEEKYCEIAANRLRQEVLAFA